MRGFMVLACLLLYDYLFLYYMSNQRKTSLTNHMQTLRNPSQSAGTKKELILNNSPFQTLRNLVPDKRVFVYLIQVLFLETLLEYPALPVSTLERLETVYKLKETNNSEIKFSRFMLALSAGVDGGDEVLSVSLAFSL